MDIDVNRTRDGIEVKPGQVWRDLSRRINWDRAVRITSVDCGMATGTECWPNGDPLEHPNQQRIAVARMHKRWGGGGWELVR